MMLMTEAPPLPVDVGLAPAFASADGDLLMSLSEEAAGPWLTVMLDEIDPSKLTTNDLTSYLQASRRLANWAESRIIETVAELSRRPDCEAPAAEVAFALCEPHGTADGRVWSARRLTRLLPKMRQALRCGDISAAHAHEVVKATARVDDPALLDKVETRVLDCAFGKTPRELGRHARNVVKKLRPKTVEQAAKDARDEADVIAYPADDDGMVDVAAHMPVEDAAIVKAGIDAYATTAKNAGDPRRIGVLRAEGLTRMASEYLTGSSSLGSAPRSGGRPIEIGITVDLRTALGQRDLPGEVPGQGIVPRDVIARMIATEAPRLRLMVIDENTGRLLYRAAAGYRPTAEQIAQVNATYVSSVGPGSSVPAARCDTDHAVEWPQGETVIGNLAPLDRSWHNEKTHRSLRVTIGDTGATSVISPLGQTRTVSPYDYRADDSPAPF